MVPEVADLDSYTPEDPAVFRLGLSLTIGASDGSPGAEIFYMSVRSPHWIERLDAGDVQWIGHDLVTTSFDWPAIRALIRAEIEGLEADTWHKLAIEISRFASWEFEG